MVLLIDTNILLDVLQERQKHYGDSFTIWRLCHLKEVEGHVSALSFADIVYIMRKNLNPERIEKVFDRLSKIFRFEDLKESDLKSATKMNWKDFEDAIQTVTAERIKADYIITRNTKDFEGSKIQAQIGRAHV